MARGKFLNKPIPKEEQFHIVDDEKLRLSLITLADKYDEYARQMIYRTYNNPEILNIYRAWRKAGTFAKGSKDKSRKKIIEYPNGYVFDFIDTVLTGLYGPQWFKNTKALKHELVKPWWVVEKI